MRRAPSALQALAGVLALVVSLAVFGPAPVGGTDGAPAGGESAPAPLAPRDFVRTVRVSGTTEATRSVLITGPRLAGSTSWEMVITRLVPPGSAVKAGDVLVEFDRQEQETAAFDRRAEYLDLLERIAKTRAEHEATRVKDRSDLEQAVNAVESLELEVLKNEMLPRNKALENDQKLEAARVRAKALAEALPLRENARAAALTILEIQRDRARMAMEHAERNASSMVIRAPMDGLVVAKMTWKGNGPGDVQEGDRVYPGAPIVEVVNVEAMRVRARVNQADIAQVVTGQPVTVRLDAYPDFAMRGRVAHVAPIATPGSFSPRVRTFTMLVAIDGRHARLMPDLTAAVDIEIARRPDALVVPREAVRWDDGVPHVLVRGPGSAERRPVTLGERSETEVVVTDGLRAGDVVAR